MRLKTSKGKKKSFVLGKKWKIKSLYNGNVGLTKVVKVLSSL